MKHKFQKNPLMIIKISKVFDNLTIISNGIFKYYIFKIFKIKYSVIMNKEQDSTQDSIQVFVRVKPGCDDQSVIYANNQIKLDKHSFAFDRIFPPSAHQEDIYLAVGKKLIAHALQGYNSCVFVYGQTGSGKTFTMIGDNNGLMQRSFCQLFSKIDRLSNTQCIVTCSYYQLYNEQIIDLLDNRKQKKNLNIRHDVKKGVFVENLTQQSALNSQRLLECLNGGMKNRHIGQTQMNRESSRSHSIFTVSLAIKSDIDGKKVLKTPKLHFVDLAGSERQKMTMATGDRLKQAGNINKSLTTLGMVINALASDKPRVHIPYRDSKLTCLLRDSLGGNSKTFIVATISTSIYCFQETLSTLNFANRAKMVKVKALINQESLSTNIEQFKDEIRKLRQQIAKLKSQKVEKKVNFEHSSQPWDSVISKANGNLQEKFSQISHKIEDLKENMINSSFETIMQKLSKNKNDLQMIDQKESNNICIQQQGNELIQYMVSNHDLLKKIHSTMQQYSDLRQQVKNVEFTKRLPLDEIKTPSKFQRNQYEQLLMKRENHIKQLEEKVVSLKEINFKKDFQLKDIKRKIISSQNSKTQDNEEIVKLKNDQVELQKKYSQIQLRYQMIMDQKNQLQQNNQQLETRLKQVKELYVYSEEKYQNEKFIRSKVESSLKELNKKYQSLQLQKRQQFEQQINKIQSLQQAILEGERREDELRGEIDILNETTEFNKKKIRQYTDKIQQNSKLLSQYNNNKTQLCQIILTLQLEQQLSKNQFNESLNSLSLTVRQAKNELFLSEIQKQKLKAENERCRQQLQDMRSKWQSQIARYSAQINNLEGITARLNVQIDELKSQNRRIVSQYDIKLFTLERSIHILNVQIETNNQQKFMIEEKFRVEKDAWQKQRCDMNTSILQTRQEIKELKVEIAHRIEKMQQMQRFSLTYKNVVEEFEQLKRNYKELLKQNYKIKGQYGVNSSTNLEQSAKIQQLSAKVIFYEEKFKLMSIQYNKVLQNTKKLKQKELTLMKQLSFFQENSKLQKMTKSFEDQEAKIERYNQIKLQNKQLKQSLAKVTDMYKSLLQNQKKQDYSKRLNLQNEKYQLQQKEEKIKKRLESSLKKWDHVKQNNWSGMSLDQLFNCWQKIENQSRKKLEGVVKAIKRQQKLKSQNKFILKENFHLKYRIQTLEKQISMEALGNPRKRIKQQEPILSE